MIEILNETFTPKISNIILKYMSHPTADIIIKKKEFDKTICKRSYDNDDDVRSDLHVFPMFFHLKHLQSRNCDMCHKFKIHHTPQRFNDLNDTYLPYHLLKIPLKYDSDEYGVYDDCFCMKCTFIDNLKCKFENLRNKNKRRKQNGISSISIVKYFFLFLEEIQREENSMGGDQKNYSRDKWLFP